MPQCQVNVYPIFHVCAKRKSWNLKVRKLFNPNSCVLWSLKHNSISQVLLVWKILTSHLEFW